MELLDRVKELCRLKGISQGRMEKEIGISIQKIRTAIDKLEEAELFDLMNLYSKEDLFKEIVPISALKKTI